MNATKNLSLGLASLALLALANSASAQRSLSGEDIGIITDGSDVTPPYGDPEIDARGSSPASRGDGSLEDDSISDDAIEDGSIDEAPGDPDTGANDGIGDSLGDTSRRDNVFEECTADSNGDGYVGFNDLVTVVSAWGLCPVNDGALGEEPVALPCPADFSRNGRVDFEDLTILLLNYGHDCLADALEP